MHQPFTASAPVEAAEPGAIAAPLERREMSAGQDSMVIGSEFSVVLICFNGLMMIHSEDLLLSLVDGENFRW